ncbi:MULTISPECIES: RHS repeat domain-containing protein [unclassified Anaeromyxobacter]|uniref:RHS repeat domain-containing protein n=1 Tax=unclassified Anaeromyxobacter TaxID=2620896 RepID=UPI001F567813|nr:MULTISPECIES: RHS repeat-associated core domain-containing protein [unclassified Anaeromyxobacter]
MTDQNGRVHEHVEYFPYGAVWRDPRSDIGASPVKGQRLLFTGKELDEETGLYYFGARYYDPVRVRWASPDPVVQRWTKAPEPWNLSLFGYALWSPQRLVDPDGEDPVESRILENPISVDYLERSGLLDRVSSEYLSQHGLLRHAIAPCGGQLQGLQVSEQNLMDVEMAASRPMASSPVPLRLPSRRRDCGEDRQGAHAPERRKRPEQAKQGR